MALDEQAYSYLKRQIGSLLDIDIDAYKAKQMRRRLETFVAAHDGGSPMVFLRRLSSDEGALEELRDMLTINVSEFFRDAAQFTMLEERILPELLKGKSELNIWSAACSYGHEPYSAAMILDDLGAAARRSKIVATDFDRRMLARAKAGGPYPVGETRNVSPERLERYFDESEGGLEVNRHLRARVQFRELNLLHDKFGTGFDLIMCRNVMIYFSAEVKLELVGRYWDSLVPGGVLFVGATEALLGPESQHFERIGGNFYRKPADAATVRRAA